VEGIDITLKPEIKWPNDIYLNGRKLAGMLIKNSISANRISNTIAGVGININQTVFGKEAPLAISLSQITGSDYDISDLLTKWHNFLGKVYLDLKNGKSEEVFAEYMDRFYLKGKAAGYIINGEKMIATIVGIGDYGQLKLISAEGREFTCGLKEVEFIPETK
jgi:BirA family biotin operon repressor/biotin-[acetyl-CoA-carboxylase] ligase